MPKICLERIFWCVIATQQYLETWVVNISCSSLVRGYPALRGHLSLCFALSRTINETWKLFLLSLPLKINGIQSSSSWACLSNFSKHGMPDLGCCSCKRTTRTTLLSSLESFFPLIQMEKRDRRRRCFRHVNQISMLVKCGWKKVIPNNHSSGTGASLLDQELAMVLPSVQSHPRRW